MTTSPLIYVSTFFKTDKLEKQRSQEAWIVISCFLLLLLFLYFASAGSLRLLYPALSLMVAIYLYIRHPVLYLGFCWWIWFLSALFVRLVDLRVGWDPSRQMLIAPYLVVFVTLATLFRNLPAAYRQGGLPFILAFSGIFYGLLIGLVNNSPVAVTRSLLDWLVPLLFAFHLFVNWRDYPSYRQNIKRVFLWCVLLTGAYGIYQFVVAPEWDRYWLIESKMFTSSGDPEPFGMRVWSTMHSTGPFGVVMLAGLLLLFTNTNPLIFPASAVGYISFLLAQTRAAWGVWLLGVFLLMSSVKQNVQMRLMITILVMAICVVPIATIEPIREVILPRLETFTNLQQDQSYNDRSGNYDRQLSVAFSSVLGSGFGYTWSVNERTGRVEVVVLDSGVLDILFTLGWFGAAMYIGGLTLLISQVLKLKESRFDDFVGAARAIGVTLLAMLLIGSVMLGLAGMIFWGFLAMAMAAHKYYENQESTSPPAIKHYR
jgi:hypothetical protein